MCKKLLEIGLFSILVIESLSAYEIVQEGKYSFIYSGNDIVGAYRYFENLEKYRISCGNPKLPRDNNKYIDPSSYYEFQFYETKKESENTILNYCKKR